MHVSPYDDHSRERFVAEPTKATAVERGDFERDRARVLHSAALRRLAAKTQVVGVGQSDFPRTRLTHSLECAQIGREIAAALGADPDLVDTACLAHDLGHPPFGHNGETALAEFAASCGGFEGNAQSLRVLTRLEAKTLAADGVSAGLNLTRATLDAATKYPWAQREGTSKFGVYDDDRAVFTWLRDGVEGERRCLEAQIMDWSDDVAYSVHDLEDGIHAGHVDVRSLTDANDRREVAELAAASYAEQPVAALEEAAMGLSAMTFWPTSFDGSLRGLVALKQMTSELIARFSSAAVAGTRASYGTDALSRYSADLVVPSAIRAECAILKAVADRFVMSRQEARVMQARDRERLTELSTTLLDRSPDALEPWLRAAWANAPDDAARRRVVVDQVASLTDTSAAAWWERWVA